MHPASGLSDTLAPANQLLCWKLKGSRCIFKRPHTEKRRISSFVGKLPFSPLMEIKSGLWYASADGRKPHFLHICAEKRCARPTEPEKSAHFKDQQGDWFSLCALSLIGSSLRLLWAGGLQASATCTTYDELRGSRPPEGSSDHSGGLGSKTHPACKNSGLKSEAPGRWTSYRARLMEQCVKMSPFHDRFVLLPLEKEAHL